MVGDGVGEWIGAYGTGGDEEAGIGVVAFAGFFVVEERLF